MLFVAMLLLSLEPPPGVIYHQSDAISATEMIQMLEAVQVVFVGERHDDPRAHQWELFLWKTLASPDRALALEMFEFDVQGILDGYLAGDISLEKFLAESRPWGNYLEAYHPLVEYAAEGGYQVIAANVPRFMAAKVARQGWDGLSDIEGADFFETISIDSTNEFYRERFLAAMEALGDRMHAMPMDKMNMYRAQLLKDAVMASSIRGRNSLFICGSFHSDFRSGIPDQLEPGTTFLTIKVVAEGEPWESDQADFIIVP